MKRDLFTWPNFAGRTSHLLTAAISHINVSELIGNARDGLFTDDRSSSYPRAGTAFHLSARGLVDLKSRGHALACSQINLDGSTHRARCCVTDQLEDRSFPMQFLDLFTFSEMCLHLVFCASEAR